LESFVQPASVVAEEVALADADAEACDCACDFDAAPVEAHPTSAASKAHATTTSKILFVPVVALIKDSFHCEAVHLATL